MRFDITRLAEVGGLLSYGASVGMYPNAVFDIGRVLKRAAPGGLPQQQPSKLVLVVNLETAAALGLANSLRSSPGLTKCSKEAPGAPCYSAEWLCRRSFWRAQQAGDPAAACS
jgi:hypothetical protein